MTFLHYTFLWILFAVVDSHSPLTDKKAGDVVNVKSSCEASEIIINHLQNQINQETVIRLSLLKQVYSLVNDMISMKNDMAAMKTGAEEIRKSTDDLRHEDKKMMIEIEQMKHDHNDTSEMIMNVQREHNKMLREIEQKMKINQNDTSERIVNVQNYLLNVNNSVCFLRNYTDEINANYDIQEKRVRDLVSEQEKIQTRLDVLYNEDERILTEAQCIIANYSETTLKIREELQNITSMVNKLQTIVSKRQVQGCLNSSNCWLLYSFEYDNSWNGCEGGTQYVKKTYYSSAPYLGVMTCSSTRYKLFLGKTLTGKYYNIADGNGKGEDNCELLGTTKNGVLPGDYKRSPNTEGFYRSDRGETFSFVRRIGSVPSQTGKWYEQWIECGVNIPGSDTVVPV
ncbi:uncharacterized protein LOC133204039 [Saccostrea echinata]|uniref:uncharacterized protein LOC133204039 n=1 Tax=Saccostrea echinata TaxID=191078 RepID=UPI002A810B90|nr:uncharacterized protein LOC133204039 [Saccostrea echinata]